MKAFLISLQIVLGMHLSLAAYGQASFGFRTYVPNFGIDVHVFDAEGQMLVRTNFLAELWGGATSNAILPLVTLSGNSREILPFTDDGYIVSLKGSLSALDVEPLGWAWLQMRAWDARMGRTYEEAVAGGLGGYGESALFYARGGDPTVIPPSTPGPLIGLQSFSLRAVVPEPSTWALLALGGIGLWWTSRRGNKLP